MDIKTPKLSEWFCSECKQAKDVLQTVTSGEAGNVVMPNPALNGRRSDASADLGNAAAAYMNKKRYGDDIKKEDSSNGMKMDTQQVGV
jgi:hypothetical protein